MSSDLSGLQRFVDAQNPVYARVCAELASGRKTSHWMWFVFPQLAMLASSAMSQRYALSGLDEAAAYAAHSVLGTRLRECTSLVLGLRGVSAAQLFGHPDELKFQSCMTLFNLAAPADLLYARALDRYYGGRPDAATLRLLGLTPTEAGASDLKAGAGSQASGGLSDK